MQFLWLSSRRKAKRADAEQLAQFVAALGLDPAMVALCKTVGDKWLAMDADEQDALKQRMSRVATALKTVSVLSPALESFQSAPMGTLTLAVAWGFILRGLVEDGEVNL